MPINYFKLGGAIALLLAALGLWGYVSFLRHEVRSLSDDLVKSEQEKVDLRLSLESATQEKQALDARLSQALSDITQARSEAAKTRSRVQKVVIPGDCPGALLWLQKEVAK